MSSEKTSAPLQHLGDVVLQQPLRQPLDERGLADAGVADEHRVVLAAAAQHLERALQLRGRGRSADRARPSRARSVRFKA